MNELFEGLSAWYHSLPPEQASFLTSGFIIMLVVGFVVKFMLKGIVKVIAIIIISAISIFWFTGWEIPILSEYFTVNNA